MGHEPMISDHSFSNRVLDRVQAAEHRRARGNRLRFVFPLSTIAIVGGCWAIAIFDGLIALRLLIDVVARVVAVGSLEQHLSTALLGPYAPIPLLASLLLLVSAVVWVRSHQPALPEAKP